MQNWLSLKKLATTKSSRLFRLKNKKAAGIGSFFCFKDCGLFWMLKITFSNVWSYIFLALLVGIFIFPEVAWAHGTEIFQISILGALVGTIISVIFCWYGGALFKKRGFLKQSKTLRFLCLFFISLLIITIFTAMFLGGYIGYEIYLK